MKGTKIALTIHVDGHKDNKDCINVINQFKFSHGKTHVNISKKIWGFEIHGSMHGKSRMRMSELLFLEDDIELSPLGIAG